MDNVFRLLSTGAIVSSAAFGGLPATKQTEVLASIAGKAVVFVIGWNLFGSLRVVR